MTLGPLNRHKQGAGPLASSTAACPLACPHTHRTLPDLTRLPDVQIGAEGIEAMLQSMNETRIVHLAVGGTKPGAVGINALVQWMQANPKLHTLSLDRVQGSDIGIKIFEPILKQHSLKVCSNSSTRALPLPLNICAIFGFEETGIMSTASGDGHALGIPLLCNVNCLLFSNGVGTSEYHLCDTDTESGTYNGVKHNYGAGTSLE